MTIDELYQELSGKIAGDSLEIQGAYGGGGFWSLLNALKVRVLTVKDVTVNIEAVELVVTGTCTPSPAGKLDWGSMALKLVCSEKDGRITYILTLSSTRKFQIAELFGELAQSGDPDDLDYGDSVLLGITISAPIITLESEYAYTTLPFEITGDIRFDGAKAWSAYSFTSYIESAAKGEFSCVSKSAEVDCLFIIDVPLAQGVPFPFGNGSLTIRLSNGLNAYPARPLSEARIIFSVNLDGLESDINLSAMLFDGDLWQLALEAVDGVGVFDIVNFFAEAFGLNAGSQGLLLPEDTLLNQFKLYDVGMLYDSKESQKKHMRAMFALAKPWVMPIPAVTLEQLYVIFAVTWGDIANTAGIAEAADTAGITDIANQATDYILTANAGAKLLIKIGGYDLVFTVAASLPSLDFAGHLTLNDNRKPSLSAMTSDYQLSTPEGWESLTVFDIDVFLSKSKRSLSIYGKVNAQWEMFRLGDMPVILKQITASIDVSSSRKAFSGGGVITFGSGSNAFSFLLGVGYDNGSWAFKGSLYEGAVTVSALAKQIFDIDISSFDIALSEFEVEYRKTLKDKKKGYFFSITAAIEAVFPFVIPGVEITAGARVSLTVEKEDESKEAVKRLDALFNGAIGNFSVLGQVNDFYKENPVYILRVAFGDKWIESEYSGGKLTVSLGGMTFGDVVEALINVFNPNEKVRLPAPWDILHKVKMSDFCLTIDTKKRSATVVYTANISLSALIQIETIGLGYDFGQSSGVFYILTGKFLGDSHSEANPVTWNAVDENPPAAVPEKNGLFHLTYLSLAQHVNADAALNARSIEDAVKALEDMAKPGYHFAYDAKSNWLIGARFTINDMIELGLVLNDPNLYGLLVKIQNGKGALAMFNDLALELSYQKVSDKTGKFKVTIQMPQKYRSFKLGAVKFTFGIMSLEVYTNGGFLIDLGFPHNSNYQRSFTLEFGQFVGRGGLYFGVLTGDAVTNVPKAVIGQFSPVVLAGIGLSVGIGRSFDFCIVKGSLSVEIFGALEGVFAIWRHLDNQEFYYKVKATVGITGKLSITVDFFIIKVNASAVITAKAMLQMESYRKSLVDLSLSLDVAASITILFITVDFSYHFSHNFSFTIGDDHTAPWELKAAKNVRLPAARRLVPRIDTRIDVNLRLMPLVTKVVEDGEKLKLALIPLLDKEGAVSLGKVILDWLLACWPNATLYCEDIFSYNHDGVLQGQAPLPISYGDLDTFLTDCVCFHLQMPWDSAEKEANEETVEGEATGCGAAKDESTDGYVMPMPPVLQCVYQNNVELVVDYASETIVSEAYSELLNKYFETLHDLQSDDKNTDAASNAPVREWSLSLAKVLFLDYFQILRAELSDRINKLYSGRSPQADHVQEPLLLSKKAIRDAIVTDEDFIKIFSMQSRFLLQGLRIPDPVNPKEIRGLYALNKQQFALDESFDVTCKISLSEESSWLILEDSEKTLEADALQALIPKGSFPRGISYSIDAAFVPAAPMWSVFDSTAYYVNGERYTLYALPPNISGTLPPLLLDENNMEEYGEFCSFIPLAIARTEKDGIYQMFGASAENRAMLLKLAESKGIMSAGLAAKTNVAGGEPEGYFALASGNDCFMLRTNLSLETRYASAKTASNPLLHKAYAGNTTAFLKLLWECSVVYGGYTLHLTETLPEEYFDECGRGYIWLLASLKKEDFKTANFFKGKYKTGAFTFTGQEKTVWLPALPRGHAGLTITHKNDDDVKNLYSIFGYSVGANDNYDASNTSMPALPTPDGEVFAYPISIPLYQFAKDGKQNPYSTLGKSAVIKLEQRDILGNCLHGKQNASITPAYNDLLIAFGELGLHSLYYEFRRNAEGKPRLCITCVPSGEDISQLINKLPRIEQALLQYQCADIQMSVLWDSVNTFRVSKGIICDYLQKWTAYLTGKTSDIPDKISWELDIQSCPLPSDNPFAMRLELIIKRTAHVRGIPDTAVTAVSPLAPRYTEKNGVLTIDSFLQNLESTFGNLKLAISGDTLYGVTFGRDGFIKKIKISPFDDPKCGRSPRYLALKPLKTGPVTREVAIRKLNGSGGLEPATAVKLFASMDMDVLARQFLEDYETILSPDVACIASAKNEKAFDEITENKKDMALAISRAVVPIYRDARVSDLQKTRDIMCDKLKNSLLAGYTIDVIGQYRLEADTVARCRVTNRISAPKSGIEVTSQKIDSTEKTFHVFAHNDFKAASAPVSLGITLSELEYDITSKAGGYESSTWLKLLSPQVTHESVTLDLSSKLHVPNPMKYCPSLPGLKSQQCESEHSTPADITDLLRWNYHVNAGYAFVEQDILVVSIAFDAFSAAARGGRRDLFDGLAEYSTMRDKLLRGISQGDSGYTATFAQIASEMTGLWNAWNTPPAKRNAAGTTLRFELSFTKTESGNIIPHIKLLSNNTGLNDPQVTVTSPGVSHGDWLDFAVEIKDIPIFTYNKAAISMYTVRNQNILCTPDEQLPVSPEFIYKTDDTALPTIKGFCGYNDLFTLGSAVSVDEAVRLLWETFIRNRNHMVKLCVWYGYRLSSGTQGPEVRTPITLAPKQYADEDLKNRLYEQVNQWISQNQPSKNNAYLLFEVNVYESDLLFLSFPQIQIRVC